MKNKIRGLAYDTIIYGVGNVFTAFFYLFFIPIIINKVSVSDFGKYNYYNTIISIFVVLIIFGFDSAMALFIKEFDDIKSKKKIYSLCLLVQLVTGFSFFTLISILTSFSYTIFFFNGVKLSFIYLILGNTFLLSIYRFNLNWFKWDNKAKIFLFLTIIYFFANISLIIFRKEVSLHDIFLFNFLSLVLSCTLAIILNFHLITNPFPLPFPFKNIFNVALPFFLIMCGSVLRSNLDRIIIVDKISGNSFGLYSFVQRISMIVGLFSFAFDVALGPFILTNWKMDGFKSKIVKLQTSFVILISLIHFCFFIFLNEIIYIIGDGKFESKNIDYIFFLTTANIIWGFNSFASIGINLFKKSQFFLISFIISILVFLVTSYLFEGYGAEYAVSISFFLGTLVIIGINFYFSNKLYSIDFNFFKDLLILLVGVMSCIFIYSIDLNLKIRILVFLVSIPLILIFIKKSIKV